MENRTYYRIRVTVGIISVILFAALIVWFSAGLINAGKTSESQQMSNVKQSVINGVVLCYSTEGSYPESVGYLKENYGLRYDESKYAVNYIYISADIRPTVSVTAIK